jgi:hypothetical protein
MNIRNIAFYRILYGADFLKESLDSIYHHFDKIIFFYTNKVWKGIESVTYFGKQIYIPHAIDNSLDIIHHYATHHDPDSKISLFNDYFDSPANQITHLINNKIMTNYNPELIVYIEPDEVWRQDHIKRLLQKPKENRRVLGYNVSRIEFWKSHQHAFRYESWRQRLYVMNNTAYGGAVNRRSLPFTNCGGSEQNQTVNCPDCDLHHFAYACSPRTVFWKHIICRGFSPGIDSQANENWFEEKWLKWSENNQIENLCPSIGFEKNIPKVLPYKFEDLPESIKNEYK